MTFYDPDAGAEFPVLPEEESHHCIRVMRRQTGDQIRVLDGKGGIYEGIITDDRPKKCAYRVTSSSQADPDPYRIHLAISPTKNSDRMEWMMEKCVEIGLHEITFLECERSERSRLRTDRIGKKGVAAMKQAGRYFMPRINQITPFSQFIKACPPETTRHIAWVPAAGSAPHLKQTKPSQAYIVLIGPEGDFTPAEVEEATQYGFKPTSLGQSTLRTETAGLVTCLTLSLIHI